MTAFNIQGSIASGVSALMFLASVPDKPALGPFSDPAETSGSQIKLHVHTVLGDGGLPLLSYELQMGSLSLNDLKTISSHSLQTNFFVTQVNKGEDYAFRYRAVNAVGAGQWSDTTILRPATVP